MMRRDILIAVLVGLLSLLGLGLSKSGQGWIVQVRFDGVEAQFSLTELIDLPAVEIEFEGHLYKGASLRSVLSQAGADIGKLDWVEPWATDGYHKRYDRRTSKEFTTILAYEKDGEPLSGEEGPLRSIYPNGPPKMMVRMVNRLLAELGTWRLSLICDNQVSEFSLEQLQNLTSREVTTDEHAYKGVTLRTFLTANGIDLAGVQSVRAAASDGASVPYESGNLDEESPLLTWEQDGSPLPSELGTVALLHQEEIAVKQLERIALDFTAER